MKETNIQNHTSVLILSAVHHEVFTAGALEERIVERVLSGHQLGKPSDVHWIISTQEGSFVFIIP